MSYRYYNCVLLLLLLLLCVFFIQESESRRRQRDRCRSGRCQRCYNQMVRLSYGYYDLVSNGPPKVIRARCRRGHQLLGEAVRTCDASTRQFTGSPPRCHDINECLNPEAQESCHEHATCVNTPGHYRCECSPDYIGDGRQNCTRIQRCPTLLPPEHGTLSATSRQADFQCEEGYVLGGYSTVTCDLYTGQWSHQPPYCLLSYNNCGNPGAPENGVKYGSCHTVGCLVRFRCNEGYSLDGDSGMECLPGQRWSGFLPVCRRSQGVDAIGASIRENLLDKLAIFSTSSVDWQALERQRLNIHHAVGIDLVFMFDRSSSIANEDFYRGVSFAEVILNEFGVANKTGATRVAAISFGTEARVEFNLNDESTAGNLTAVIAKLKAMQPSGGGTATAAAFNLLVEHVRPQLRDLAKHAIFLITDGRSNMGGSPEAIARNIRTHDDMQFEIYAVGVGNDVDRRQLRRIASEPYLEHVFLVEDYGVLDELSNIILEKRTNYERCGVSGNIEIIQGQEQQAGPEGRVAGGDEANQGAWPWVTLIKTIREDGGTDVLCAGALLCSGWVLTSAECLEKPDRNGTIVSLATESLTVTAGEHNRYEDEGTEQTAVVREIIRHQDYEYGESQNNIALLKLEPELIVNKYVRTICVPKNDSEVTLKKITHRPSTVTRFAGWGTMDPASQNQTELGNEYLSDVPRQIRIPVVDRDFCEVAESERITEDTFCAGYQYLAQDVCKGDAGGPLVVRSQKDQFFVIGVAHKQEACAQINRYGIFTDVLLFHDWINDNTEGCNLPFH